VLEVKVNHFDGSMNAMHKKTGINRQTLMKFEKDVDGRYHVMRVEGDKWQLLTAVGRG
jgi:DNA-binding XRE family transcriptional regulator